LGKVRRRQPRNVSSCQNAPSPYVDSAEHPLISKIYLSDIIIEKIDDMTDNGSGENPAFTNEKRAHCALFSRQKQWFIQAQGSE
jgi:hypothetical protein